MSKDSKVNSSAERHTFQKERYIERKQEEGLEPLEEYIEMFKTWKEQDEANLVDPAWQKDNMEYDLRSTKWICDKAKANKNYAQNLYAAMCNMQFIKLDVMPILKDQRWSCSWRSSGGIIADMLEKGDYIDWYCSGINPSYDEADAIPGYVPEGVVTDEIREDLKKLGWVPVPWDDQEI
jgi:hypothetical protein